MEQLLSLMNSKKNNKKSLSLRRMAAELQAGSQQTANIVCTAVTVSPCGSITELPVAAAAAIESCHLNSSSCGILDINGSRDSAGEVLVMEEATETTATASSSKVLEKAESVVAFGSSSAADDKAEERVAASSGTRLCMYDEGGEEDDMYSEDFSDSFVLDDQSSVCFFSKGLDSEAVPCAEEEVNKKNNKKKSLDLSFRDSFYEAGTDWRSLYEIDEYGLPCSETAISNPKCPSAVIASLACKEDILLQGGPDGPVLGAQEFISGRPNWYKKDDSRLDIVRCPTRLKQVDLHTFLGVKRKPSPEKQLTAMVPGKQDIGKYLCSSSLVKQPAASAADFMAKFQRVNSSAASPSGNGSHMKGRGGLRRWGGWGEQDGATRRCPFYKKIPGTPFTVDAFRYGGVDGCKAYFLTHFHSDHYGGLTKSWSHGLIFCTPVTARLVSMCLYVDMQWLRPVELGVPHVIEGVEVRFLEANHCPGASLILFQLPGGQRILHTGDFRACKGMQTYPELCGSRIFSLYLDTTYCDPKYKFPLQQDVIAFVVKVTRAAMAQNSRTLVVVGAYSIGKERVYLGIAKALGLKIFADQRRGRVLSSLDWPELTDRLCLDATSSMLHVLPISSLNVQKLRAYMQSFHPRYSAVLGFRPTGWTYSEKVGTNLDLLKPQRNGAVTIYGVPYSEHSSFTELQEFVQFIRPQKIIPTVNMGSASQRERMQSFFNQWLCMPHHH